jgi:hypothetical protein
MSNWDPPIIDNWIHNPMISMASCSAFLPSVSIFAKEI